MLNDNTKQHRYELFDEGQFVGYVQYQTATDAITLVHTEIEPGHEGKGYGSRLARDVLEEMRKQHRRIIPKCEFIAGYIRKHPEYLDVVKPESRWIVKTDT